MQKWPKKQIPYPTFKQWAVKGIKAVCTLMEKNKEEQTFQKLKETFSFHNLDLFRYIQFRDYYNKEIKMEISHEINPVIKNMINAYKPNSKSLKVISMFYDSIMECMGNSTLYLKLRWEK